MSDYIERKAALAYPIRKDHYDREHGNKHFILGIESVIEFVENLPAADVAPVRHGRWISTGAISCKCSECRHLELKTRTLEYAYCPACGTLMDGEEDNT